MKSLLKTSTIITILIGLNSTATIADVTSQRNPYKTTNMAIKKSLDIYAATNVHNSTNLTYSTAIPNTDIPPQNL